MTVSRIGILAVGVAAFLGHVSATVALADDNDARRVEEVAVAYARSFAEDLAGDAAEADRLGVSAATLLAATTKASYPVHLLDPTFARDGDERSLEQALVESSLWWVVLSGANGESTVVTVDWAGGQEPRPAGLNWVAAGELRDAIANFDAASVRVVWPAEDYPLVLGKWNGRLLAMAVIQEAVAEPLGIQTGPRSVVDYSRDLRARIRARPPADAGPLSAGGRAGIYPSSDVEPGEKGTSASLVVPALAVAVVSALMLFWARPIKPLRRRRL